MLELISSIDLRASMANLSHTKANPCRKFEHVHPHIGLVTPNVHNAADHILLISTRQCAQSTCYVCLDKENSHKI